ncbi:MAG: cytochrome c [Nitrospirales bacterium]
MNTRLIMSVGMVCVMLSGGVVLANVATGDAEKGKEVFRTHCLNCHGSQGRGDGPVADQLTPRPANLTSEKVQQKSDNDLLIIVREGKQGTSMPAWKGELSDQKMLDVLAYLRGLVK